MAPLSVLLLGATGATGRHLLEQLLDRGHAVRAVVRSVERLPEHLREHESLSVTEAAFLDLSDEDIAGLVEGCDAVAACLGHNLTFSGIWGEPRRLCLDSARRVCEAIKKQSSPSDRKTKYVAMGSNGVFNADEEEVPTSTAESWILSAIRNLIPPHADNEECAEFFRTTIGKDDERVEWAIARPDDLLNEDEVTPYEVFAKQQYSPIFGPGVTSRINVAHFMADLITDEEVWSTWKGKMPTIYNKVEKQEEQAS